MNFFSVKTTHPDPIVIPVPKSPPVLCVDLDGTLLATDVLWESVILLIKQQPWMLFAFPLWIFRGPAYFKRQVAQRVILDPSRLPYRHQVLSYLHQMKEEGRTLVLATASDHQPAEAIATHLGIFSDVLASNGVTNLSGWKKCHALESRFGTHGFDYIGDSSADLEVWPSANAAILVNPSGKVMARAESTSSVTKVFPRNHQPSRVLLKTLRIHQWVKNLLLFLPLIASHQLSNEQGVFQACMAFISLSFCASVFYIFNDLLDLSADRNHPKKKFRPLASGELPIILGLLLIPALLIGSFGISLLALPSEFAGLLGLYALTTIGYSFFLKQIPVLDVLILAGLYTLRVLGGGIAANVPISAWLLAFSMFLFLSLAFGKRHSELQLRKVSRYQGLERRGYLGVDKEALGTMGIVSGYLSVLVMALYINSRDVLALYQNPHILWLTCPLLLYWISRTWLLAHRGGLDDDPLVMAMKDPQSYTVAAAIGLLGLLAI